METTTTTTTKHQQQPNYSILVTGNDYVSNLKIYCEKEHIPQPVYIIKADGETTNFVCDVTIMGRTCTGVPLPNKKAAKQLAAKVACLFVHDSVMNEAKIVAQRRQQQHSVSSSSQQPNIVVFIDMDNFATFIDSFRPEQLQRLTVYGFTSNSTTAVSCGGITGITIVKASREGNTKMVHLMMAVHLGSLLAKNTTPIDRLVIVAGDKVALPLVTLCSEEIPLWCTPPLSVIHCKRLTDLNNL